MPERVGGNKAKRLLLPDVSPRLISSKWFTYFVMRPASTLQLRSLTALVHYTLLIDVTVLHKHIISVRTAYGTFEWETVCYERPSTGAPSIRSRRRGRRRPAEIDQLSNVHMTKSHPTYHQIPRQKENWVNKFWNLTRWIQEKRAGQHLTRHLNIYYTCSMGGKNWFPFLLLL